mmetsp:Transcript_25362/g.30058  ORF Transcript_25362/g.30058 Transcript_25362/m.30058 type:complete len:209 (+) Transcript_25362:111-737(+)
MSSSLRLVSPSSERNKAPILAVLSRILSLPNENSRFLEVASGTGQHIAHFCQPFPHIQFSPSDLTSEKFSSISAWCQGFENVDPPQVIDCASPNDWKITDNSIQTVYAANLCHISPYSATVGLFGGASKVLTQTGHLLIYGPFTLGGKHNSEGNVEFDRSLQSQNPDWGYRDIDDLMRLGDGVGLELEERVEMPANNWLLIFSRAKTH